MSDGSGVSKGNGLRPYRAWRRAGNYIHRALPCAVAYAPSGLGFGGIARYGKTGWAKWQGLHPPAEGLLFFLITQESAGGLSPCTLVGRLRRVGRVGVVGWGGVDSTIFD